MATSKPVKYNRNWTEGPRNSPNEPRPTKTAKAELRLTTSSPELLSLLHEAKADLRKCQARRALAALERIESVLSAPLAPDNGDPESQLPEPHPGNRATDWQQLAKHAGYNANKAANALGLTSRQLSQQCRDQNGCSCRKLLRNVQMQAAVELLLGGLPVKDVAATLLYRNPGNFSRSFKRTYGVSPWEFARRKSYHHRAE